MLRRALTILSLIGLLLCVMLGRRYRKWKNPVTTSAGARTVEFFVQAAGTTWKDRLFHAAQSVARCEASLLQWISLD